MNLTKAVLAIILFTTLVNSFTLFNLIDISNKTRARCMDGSNYGFYLLDPYDIVNKDQNAEKRNVLIYFQQNDFAGCAKQDISSSLQNCHKWTQQGDYMYDFASSNQWDLDLMFLTGMLSSFDDGAFNYSWTKVLIKSCDGGSYLGSKDPITYKRQKIYFRGADNVQQTFKYLKSKKYLDNTNQVVLSGSFNGGIAALMWQDQLQKLTNSSVKVIVDGAVYLNQINEEKQQKVFQNKMQAMNKLMFDNYQLPKKQCHQKYGESQKWKCLFIENLYPFLTVNIPVFYLQSYYDGWHITQILGLLCAEQFASLSQCSQQHRQIIQNYAQNVTGLLKKLVSAPSSLNQENNNGAFGIACVAHSFVFGRYDNDWFEVPMNSGNLVIKVLGDWVNSKTSTHVYLDSVLWPQNSPCAKKAINEIGYLHQNNIRLQKQ